MRTVYIDAEFKCHTVDDGTMRAVNTSFFDGKCDTFVEGYRCVPEGETWVTGDEENQVVITGEMIAPWMDYERLAAAQRQYEQEQMADMENALKILLGGDAV